MPGCADMEKAGARPVEIADGVGNANPGPPPLPDAANVVSVGVCDPVREWEGVVSPVGTPVDPDPKLKPDPKGPPPAVAPLLLLPKLPFALAPPKPHPVRGAAGADRSEKDELADEESNGLSPRTVIGDMRSSAAPSAPNP